jgi:carbonic anhydrase/acetyltransferase-like protein (isoleucine patch superfamily)
MLRPYRGRLPVVDPTAFVDPSAQVIGDVEIGSDSSVWMNVVVRGDVNRIRVGRRTNRPCRTSAQPPSRRANQSTPG